MSGEQNEVGGEVQLQLRLPYRVRLELFEGPLDLLLHLIKKNEVDVRELPVAKITEQYLGYLDLMRDLNLDIAGEYLVMAATLTLIKSRMLLPSPEPEEGEIDPREDPARQLLEYQRYREAAELGRAAAAAARHLHPRAQLRGPAAGAGGRAAHPGDPVGADGGVPGRAQARTAGPGAPGRRRGGVVARAHRLAALDPRRRAPVTFESLFGEQPTRGYVIVTFLAVLELMKQHVVEALQEVIMGPILITLTVEDVHTVAIDLLEEYDGTTAAGAEAAPPAEE
ncbi:MAG: segregation/condensation protein A [Candidatus Binatia bacterium]